MGGMRSRRRFIGAGIACVLTGGLAACGGSPSSGSEDGVVTISVNGMPPKTQPVDRKYFEEDVRAFEKEHPKIKIDAREGQMDPKTFSAKLAGGSWRTSTTSTSPTPRVSSSVARVRTSRSTPRTCRASRTSSPST